MACALINGVELEYEIVGEGEPIVFVSGTGVGGAIWSRSQLPHFSTTRHV